MITPNGDGVNDEVVFDFNVLKVSQPRRIRATVYDVGGEMVAKMMDEAGLYGSYRVHWDGRDSSGQPVLPGIYLCQIQVNADPCPATRMAVVTVVY